VVHGSEVAR